MKTATIPAEQAGHQLSPGYFGAFAGRALRDIIDPLGRVYKPHPYDIPQWKWRVLNFAAQLILAMIDTGHVKGGPKEILVTEKEVLQLRGLLQDITGSLWRKDSIIEDTPSSVWDPNTVLLKPERIRAACRRLSDREISAARDDEESFDPKELGLAKDHRLVVVVTVRQLRHRPGSDKIFTKWDLAFDATDGQALEILKQAVMSDSRCEVEYYEVPVGMLADPTLRGNQLPQFVCNEK